VIVPAHSDVKVVEWASRHMYERLLGMGIRIYERQDRMLHSKVMTIDDQWSVIGSCNIDPRSFLLNLEFMAVIRSAEAASAVEAICRDELRNSKLVKYAHTKRLSCVARWLNRFAFYFRRWL
jgi:cardiolipin synthase